MKYFINYFLKKKKVFYKLNYYLLKKVCINQKHILARKKENKNSI